MPKSSLCLPDRWSPPVGSASSSPLKFSSPPVLQSVLNPSLRFHGLLLALWWVLHGNEERSHLHCWPLACPLPSKPCILLLLLQSCSNFAVSLLPPKGSSLPCSSLSGSCATLTSSFATYLRPCCWLVRCFFSPELCVCVCVCLKINC